MEGRNASSQNNAEEALKLIREEKALIKIINTPIEKKLPTSDAVGHLGNLIVENELLKNIFSGIELQSLEKNLKNEQMATYAPKLNLWDGIINSLNAPGSHRYVKPLVDDVDRAQHINPRLLNALESKDPTEIEWTVRTINPVRGTPKQEGWRYTKKMSTSLLPTNGKMYYYQDVAGKNSVGLLFNLEQCDLKNEKYIWPESGVTDYRWWLKSNAHHPRRKSISLEELRQHLRNKVTRNEIPTHNEILACLSKEALKAVFATSDNLLDRLNALRIQRKLQQDLGITLPILVIDPEKAPRIYSSEEQLTDIKIVMQQGEDTDEYCLLQSAIINPQAFVEEQEALLHSSSIKRNLKFFFNRLIFNRSEDELVSKNSDIIKKDSK